MEKLEEKLLSSSYLYRGLIINVRQDRVRLPGGAPAMREVVEHPGAVAILALDEAGKVILVRQYRHPAGTILLEIPAGKLEPGEEPLECARRELAEETGMQARAWEKMAGFFVSPGFCTEKIHLFLARDLYEAEAVPDEDEALEIIRLPLSEARSLAAAGAIVDAKTLIALYLISSMPAAKA